MKETKQLHEPTNRIDFTELCGHEVVVLHVPSSVIGTLRDRITSRWHQHQIVVRFHVVAIVFQNRMRSKLSGHNVVYFDIQVVSVSCMSQNLSRISRGHRIVIPHLFLSSIHNIFPRTGDSAQQRTPHTGKVRGCTQRKRPHWNVDCAKCSKDKTTMFHRTRCIRM